VPEWGSILRDNDATADGVPQGLPLGTWTKSSLKFIHPDLRKDGGFLVENLFCVFLYGGDHFFWDSSVFIVNIDLTFFLCYHFGTMKIKTKITLFALALLFTPSFASASTPVSGTLPGDTTWTTAGSPYIVSVLTIPAGITLTVNPGVVVKFDDLWGAINVNGALVAEGTPGDRISFTSLRDDTAGGNTDGDRGNPSAGDWNRIYISSSGTASFSYADIRYGGVVHDWFHTNLFNDGTLNISHSDISHAYQFGIRHAAGTTTISQSSIHDNGEYGILAGGTGTVSVNGSSFSGNISAIGDIELGSGLVFSNLGNTATGAGKLGFVMHGSLATNQTWQADGVPYIISLITIPEEKTLTVNPGVVVKFDDLWGAINVNGALVAEGTPGDRISFTSLRDDTAGGNTDGDRGNPSAGDWNRIYISSSGTASFSYADIRYGGVVHDWFHTNLFNDGTLNISHSDISHAYQFGIRHAAGTTTISQSSIHDNGEYGVYNDTTVIINARNNYWGSISGPTHPGNPLGTGSRVSDYVDYTPYLMINPTIAPTECAENCNSNILFLPGIAGSRLYEVSENVWERCASDVGDSYFKRWFPETDCDNTKLEMDPSGISYHDLVTKDVADEVAIPGVGLNIYKTFLGELGQWKNDEHIIADYSAVPYDWRLSLDDLLIKGKKNADGYIDYSAYPDAGKEPYIMSELMRLASSSRTHKVTIVAHSNGGLVAKELMRRLQSEGKENMVDKIILVAVPEVGTPDAVATLLHGSKMGPLGIVSDTAQTREVSKNMPSAYNLLPSPEYFTTDISQRVPIASFDNSALYTNQRNAYEKTVENYDEITGYVLGLEDRPDPTYNETNLPAKGNNTLFTKALVAHGNLDAWRPASTTEVIEVAGWGIETLAGIEYGSETYCAKSHREWFGFVKVCDEYGIKPKLKNILTVNGDETVVSDSAHYLSDKGTENVEKWWVDVSAYNDAISNISRTHKNILEINSLRQFIKNNILGISASLNYISQTKPTSKPDIIMYTLRSPLTLNLYDDFGNHTGYSTATGELEENIRGARYYEIGETKFIVADPSIAQHIMLKGYAEGSFSLEIQTQSGDTITAGMTFSAIPSDANTTVTLDIPENIQLESTELPMQIDFNSDGVTDTEIISKPNQETIYDVTPSDVTLSFDQISKSLKVEGFDAVSSTTIQSTATSTVIADEAGNTTEILFSKFKTKKNKLELVISGIKQNGVLVSTSTIPLTYKWNIGGKKEPTFKTLASYVKTPATKVETHYRPKKDVTVVMTKPIDLDDEDDGDEVDLRPTKEKLSGMHTVQISVKSGKIEVGY
jgi:pimeloyl-ACP methyl ester carboxylesterase